LLFCFVFFAVVSKKGTYSAAFRATWHLCTHFLVLDASGLTLAFDSDHFAALVRLAKSARFKARCVEGWSSPTPFVRAPLAHDIDHLLVKNVRFAIEARF
jgi:hypothetical protein